MAVAEPVVEHHHHTSDSSSSLNLIIGLIVLAVILLLFFYYGLPLMRSASAPSAPTQVSVPEAVDVNVNNGQ